MNHISTCFLLFDLFANVGPFEISKTRSMKSNNYNRGNNINQCVPKI